MSFFGDANLAKAREIVARYPRAVAELPKVNRILSRCASFAARTYYPFHAYKWVDGDDGERYVRYRWLPTIDEPDLSRADAKRRGPDYLFDDLAERLGREPVSFRLEVQIADGARAARGTGSIYTFAEARAQPGKPMEWNTLEVTLKGSRISTAINGTPVAEFDSSGLKPDAEARTGEGDPARGPRPVEGYIGLQNHDEDSVVYFREVSVRPLPAE